MHHGRKKKDTKSLAKKTSQAQIKEAKISLECLKIKVLDEKLKENFIEQIQEYKQIFHKYNKTHNISNFELLNEQIIDSIKVLDFVDLCKAKRIVDVGCGAGFPGLFLAMLLPNTSFILFEPNPKKAAFLSLIKARFALFNTSVKCMRVQDDTPSIKADFIISRALMSAKGLLNITKTQASKDSKMLLWKGSLVKSELDGLEYEIYNHCLRNYVLIKNIFL